MNIEDLELAHAVKPDGVIGQFTTPGRVAMALGLRVPAINVSAVIETELPLVCSDNSSVGALAAQHFLTRRYGQLCVYYNSTLLYARLRALAFKREAEEAGATCVLVDEQDLHLAPSQVRRERQLAQWMKALPAPMGLFMAVSWGGFMLGHIAKAAGKRIPEDLAVITLGDDRIGCEMDDPPISSVDADGIRVGYEAARAMVDLVEGKAAPVRSLLIPPIGVTARGSTSTFGTSDPDVLAALQFIRDQACRGIGVTDVCEAVAMSRSTLQRRFTQIVGRTILDEIQRVRLDQAKYLLTYTDLPPATVARRAGFGDASALCHVFRRCVGMSPGAFRAQGRPTST